MIELAVSISIASIVVIGLYGLFTMQSQQLMTQDMRMEMHQNARFGMEILSRSVRMAGFGSNGTILGVLGTGGQNSSQLPAVISYDANNVLWLRRHHRGLHGTFIGHELHLLVNRALQYPNHHI